MTRYRLQLHDSDILYCGETAIGGKLMPKNCCCNITAVFVSFISSVLEENLASQLRNIQTCRDMGDVNNQHG